MKLITGTFYFDDVDIHNGIIQPLIAEYILNEEDAEIIKKGVSKQERAQILLDLLPQYVSKWKTKFFDLSISLNY